MRVTSFQRHSRFNVIPLSTLVCHHVAQRNRKLQDTRMVQQDPLLVGPAKPTPSPSPFELVLTAESARGPAGRKGAQKRIVAGERRRSASHAHELKAALGWLVLIYPRASVFPCSFVSSPGLSARGSLVYIRAFGPPPTTGPFPPPS